MERDTIIIADNISKAYKLGSSCNSKILWALKNVSFEINQGEKVAIMGDNGAGKSTLLKIISRITAPTTGKITGMGRIISMLEVGTGFHPDLSGLQNIYLNGAMHGMSKNEIKRDIEEIVSFAEIQNHINMPVKRYSSGQYMRLAFSVAAHLQSEILIADEVLAVGDSNFQQQCLTKLNDLCVHKGKTIIMVCHNSSSLKFLCDKQIRLRKGQIV